MAKMKLQPRERLVLMLGAVGVVLIGGYGISQGPYQAYARSNNEVAQARERLTSARITQATVQRDREKQAEVKKKLPQAGKFNLWSEVDKAVKDLKLGKRCSMRSNRGMSTQGQESSSVEVTLNGVSSQELVDLVHRVYDTGYFVYLSQLMYLRPSNDQKGLDCRMTFVAPQA
ncbi:MAG: hypothetical protein FJY92_04720 [Candidatus Hydrogenedentes bacterium]|nr:hypothetical protein [Candidatus Hydrogenedentota bacterium]